MYRKLAGLSIAMLLLVTAALLADTPQVNNVSQLGVQRGVETSLTISGANLKGNARIYVPFGHVAQADDQDAGNLKVKLTVAAETPVGIYPIRVRTDDGLSNPFLIAVGQVPEVAEQEDNSTPDKAQAIPSLCAVEGQAAGNDVDYFKFPGKKGERIVVDAQCARVGSGLDPQIRLTTIGRKFLASADDSPGLATDARLIAELPEDGEYLLEISDSKYQGANRPAYRLMIGAIPTAAESFPAGGRRGHVLTTQVRGGTLPAAATLPVQLNAPAGVDHYYPRLPAASLGLSGDAGKMDVELLGPLVVGDLPEAVEAEDAPKELADLKLVPPIVINGRLEKPGKQDRHTLAVSPGQKLRISLRAAELGSALDAQVQVFGANNAVIANGDDTPLPVYPRVRKKADQKKAEFVSPDSTVDITVPDGLHEITIGVRDLEGGGGVGFPYRLAVTPTTPTYELWLDESEIDLPKGGLANVYVIADRAGYAGPIQLGVPNLPAGVTARSAPIAEGQTVGLITLTAAADAKFDLVELKVLGTGQGPDGPIVRMARKPVVFAQQNGLPTKVVTQGALPLALTGPSAITIQAAPEAIELAIGTEASVPLRVARGEGADAGLAVTPVTALPKGVSQGESKVAEKAAEGKAAFKADGDAPVGVVVVGLEAKGKIAGKDRSYDIPWVTLNIIRPVQVELAGPAVVVKPGETAEFRGKIVRKGGFAEPVTIKADALPKGLKADPVTLEGEASEFALKIVAEADAPEAKAEAKVVPAFQVNKKDYATPPIPFTVEIPKKVEGP